jgi:hypothetical protein
MVSEDAWNTGRPQVLGAILMRKMIRRNHKSPQLPERMVSLPIAGTLARPSGRARKGSVTEPSLTVGLMPRSESRPGNTLLGPQRRMHLSIGTWHASCHGLSPRDLGAVISQFRTECPGVWRQVLTSDPATEH